MAVTMAMSMTIAVRMTVSLRVAVRTFPAGMRMLNLHLKRLEQYSQQTQDAEDPGEVANTLFHHDLTINLGRPKINRHSTLNAASSQNVRQCRIFTYGGLCSVGVVRCRRIHRINNEKRFISHCKNRGFITD
ncbi:hypothetical protein Pan110_10590 [Gimesia panareensis]|nr:hypothetical protein Pan110_10590 [Gimesia panareensis]